MLHADWMSKLPDALRQRPLSQIAIPGTHDSGTSDISSSSPEGPDLGSLIKAIDKATCDVSKKVVANWSVTQDLDLTAQMNGGIRYLDLRLAYDTKLKDFFITHGLLSTSLIKVLYEVQAFLKAQPGEVMLLDFNHFYAMDDEQHIMATQMIMQYLSDQLYPFPFSTGKIPSIKDCVDNNLRAILFYHASYPNMELPFWPSYTIPAPWANTPKVKTLLSFLEDKYKNGRNSTLFYVTQGIITPDTGMIIKNVCGSLRSITDEVNPAFINWFKSKTIGPQGINICTIDFCQYFEYVSTLLSLNR